MNSFKKQVKSKQRVFDHGEVFTNEREVNAMLDLVKSETNRIESRFLEPACGNGNFLVEVLKRKLQVVRNKYKKNYLDYEKYSIVALSSIYGVDILQDNVEECIKRLFDVWNEQYENNCKTQTTDLCRKAAKYILKHNILCGDALTMKNYKGEPIIFAQWDLVMGNLIKRRDYRLDELIQSKNVNDQITMDMIDYGVNNWKYDSELDAMMPNPIKEYLPIDYRKVQENE